MGDANQQLMRRWFEEVWNLKRESAVDEMYPEGRKAHGLPYPDSEIVGPGAFKEFRRGFLKGFPDIHITLEDSVADQDRVAVRWTATMTHQGEFSGVAPTGKPARLSGATFARIEDGVIIEAWNFMDLSGFVQRLKDGAA
jgi:predicted ester cyclase